MKRLVLMAVLMGFVLVSGYAQVVPDKAAQAPKAELPRFDLYFEGGSPTDLVEQLNKRLEGKLNVIIPSESDDVMIPPMRLKNVNVTDVFQALGRASEKTISFRVGKGAYQSAVEAFNFTTQGTPTENSVWAFRANRPVIPKFSEDRGYRFYQLGPYLSDLKIEDITTAIQTAQKMLKIEVGPELKFHPETKLLIAVGTETDFALIEDVLSALPKNDQKQMRGMQILVNGFVNKPGNILLSKDQKVTILEAIGQAGGLDVHTGSANKTIKFSRPGQTERVFKFDELKRESDTAKVIYLEPGDVIDVGL